MSEKQNLAIEIKEEKDLIEQYKKDVQSEAYRLTIEDINQRLDAGQEISDEEKDKIIEENLEKILSNTKTLSPNEFHKMICKILMVMAVIGGFFALSDSLSLPNLAHLMKTQYGKNLELLFS